jgi:hypothetical protein
MTFRIWNCIWVARNPLFYGLNEQFYISSATDHVLFETAMRVAPRDRKNPELFNDLLRQSNVTLLELPW